MFNNRALVIIVVLVVLGWLASSSLYVVDETERAIKLRFGEVVESDIGPGLHAKVPVLNTVRTFDSRVLTLDASASRYLTQEKKAVIVDSYIKWKIINPQRFYEATTGDEQVAERLIEPRVDEALRNEFGRNTLSQIVSERRDELMSAPTKALDKQMRNELGVAVLDIRVKQIELPEEVTQSVYDRMRSEREREAREYRAQGQEQAEKIRARVDREKQVLLARARQIAETTRGEGDASAAAIYGNAYQQNPDFFRFYRSLQAYRDSFGDGNGLLVLNPHNNDFFRFLLDPQGAGGGSGAGTLPSP
ncbi:protease FtsH subunit HflC [Kushneria sinocarnis]|uniref:Protein HflC n=1 Tax=Kushneria sinocarnis TaxID=595502 RepID=A0A420WTH1_9GAMM|nr:protease modulator HflC [Kushneria sinocarnis]RKQ96304.1 protease FtsH subunit HflC [Kushneria sinocarnis]